ncbi:hypothetical protein B0H17DRAFT_1069357 [Mycena rosella]|uniref:Uncharacterized protein n=1 Tax=Mycena rosella TaxID=1033263 RepID=A0AAD7DDT9_MYCRO|nr:hypothetical protein B0H17DRAFT_1069357 [Mycena rosella]
MRILEAKIEFMLSLTIAKHSEEYPVFVEADVYALERLNPTASYTMDIARLLPLQTEVIVRRYQSKHDFSKDIKELSTLRHPNLPFLGASTFMAAHPFIVLESKDYLPANKAVILSLQSDSRQIAQKKVIEIICDLLEGMNHLQTNNRALSGLETQMSEIQYNGRKVILNVELPPRVPPRKPLSFTLPPPAAPGERLNPASFLKNLFAASNLFLGDLDLTTTENDVLQNIMTFPDLESVWGVTAPAMPSMVPDMPSALRPIWQYFLGSSATQRLPDLRTIRSQFRGSSGQPFDARGSLLATGSVGYLDFSPTEADDAVELGSVAYFQSGRLVVICNVVEELREQGIIGLEPFISTWHDSDPYKYGEDYFVKVKSSTVTESPFKEITGDHLRYEFLVDEENEVGIAQFTKISLHDREDLETRCRVQQYFHSHVQSLAAQQFPNATMRPCDFILVTSVTTMRTTRLEHNDHYSLIERASENLEPICLPCIFSNAFRQLRPAEPETAPEPNNLLAYFSEGHEPYPRRRGGFLFFHVFPDLPPTNDAWGLWNFSIPNANGEQYEMHQQNIRQKISYAYDPQWSFDCALAECD